MAGLGSMDATIADVANTNDFLKINPEDIVDQYYLKDTKTGTGKIVNINNKRYELNSLNERVKDKMIFLLNTESTGLDIKMWIAKNILIKIKPEKREYVTTELIKDYNKYISVIIEEQNARKDNYTQLLPPTPQVARTGETNKPKSALILNSKPIEPSIIREYSLLPKSSKIQFGITTSEEFKANDSNRQLQFEKPINQTLIETGLVHSENANPLKTIQINETINTTEIESFKKTLKKSIDYIIVIFSIFSSLRSQIEAIEASVMTEIYNLKKHIIILYNFLFKTQKTYNMNNHVEIFKSYIYYQYFKILQKFFDDLNKWYLQNFGKQIVKTTQLSRINTSANTSANANATDERYSSLKPTIIKCIAVFLDKFPNEIGYALNRKIQDQQPFNLEYIESLSDKLNRNLLLELPNAEQQANQTWRCGYTILINGMSNAECQWAIPDGGFEEIGKQMELESKDRLKQIQYERSICKHGDTYKAMLARSVKGGRRTRQKQRKQKKTQKRHKKRTNKRKQKKCKKKTIKR
jgi:hypothetical protein